MIHLKNVHKSYGVKDKQIPALNGIDLSIVRGEIFGVIGHSGAGKDALILESGQSNYVNFLAARTDNKDSPAMKKLAAALRSPESKKFMLE